MTHLTDDEANELRRLAHEATPGPWDTIQGNLVRAIKDDLAVPIFRSEAPLDWHKNKRITHSVMCKAYADEVNNAAFIAAFNPKTALALLTELAELRAERAVLQRENLDALYGWDAEHRRAEKAEAELKEAEAAQASTARRVAEGIAREAKLREALEPFALIFIEIIEPSISSCGSAPQYSTIKTCTDYFERARAALKEGQE